MGIDGPPKIFYLVVYGKGAVFPDLPRGPVTPIYVFDHTTEMKKLSWEVKKHKEGSPLRTGDVYLRQQVLKGPEEAFRIGARSVYMCLDRGSPKNKGIEQEKRKKAVKVIMPTPEEDRSPEGSVLNDYRIPPD